jgi:LPXTG-motif cell wall-anchored protein
MNRVILVVIYILVVALCLTFEIMGSPCKHENTHTDTVASNCTKGGTSTVICDDCGEILSTRTLAKNDKHTIVAGRCSLCGAEKCEKTGGNHTFKVYRSTPGTCKDRGYEWKKCSGCGYDKVAETVFGDHTYVDGVCSLCGDVDQDYVPKTGDNSVVIMAGMFVVAMVSALGYVYVKKETSCC